MLVTSIKKQNRLVGQKKELVLENSSITVLEVINMLGILFWISSDDGDRHSERVTDCHQVCATELRSSLFVCEFLSEN
jgi:hypothetical protein